MAERDDELRRVVPPPGRDYMSVLLPEERQRVLKEMLTPEYARPRPDRVDIMKAGPDEKVGPGQPQTRDIAAQAAFDLATSLPGGAAKAAAAGPLKAIFLGIGAKTANRPKLALARKLEEMGHVPAYIKRRTGWERGAEDAWKFEISDDLMTYTSPPSKWPIEDFAFGKAGDYVNHPELFKAYPDMADIRIAESPYTTGGTYYQKTPTTKEGIDLDVRLSPEMKRSVILHELTHGVQKREGFAKGGNVTMYEDYDDPKVKPLLAVYDQLHDDYKKAISSGDSLRAGTLRTAMEDLAPKIRYMAGYAAYKRIAGEVEARNVQTRAHFTPEERRRTPAAWTEDVPRNKQILHFYEDEDVSPPAVAERMQRR